MGDKLNYIDLFAGAGGLSEGFKKAGYNPIAHVEMDLAACLSLKTRVAYHHLKATNQFSIYEYYLRGDICRTDLYKQIPKEELDSVINLALGEENNQTIFNKIDAQLQNKKVDLIVGGPPCQAYSLVGRSRSSDNMESDPRNHLYIQYAEYLKKYQPKMFVFENVLGLLSANRGAYFKMMVVLFAELGYEIQDYVLNATDFGVLQNRRRVVLIGYKKELKLSLPDFKTQQKKGNLVSSVLADLPTLQSGEGVDKYVRYATATNDYLKSTGIRNGINVLTQHISRPHKDYDKEIYRIAINLWDNEKKRLNYNDLPERLIKHNNTTSFFDRFKVVAANEKSSQTVVAHIAKDGHYYIHPDIKQNRSLTVREAARLQSFPDDFYFEGVKEGKNRTAAFKQIGNAVPPLMAKEIANEIKKIIK